MGGAGMTVLVSIIIIGICFPQGRMCQRCLLTSYRLRAFEWSSHMEKLHLCCSYIGKKFGIRIRGLSSWYYRLAVVRPESVDEQFMRWWRIRSFISQGPLALILLALAWWRLKSDSDGSDPSDTKISNQHLNLTGKLLSVDFIGSALLIFSIVAFLLAVNVAAQELRILDPLVLCLCGLWVGNALLFWLVEAYVAREPIYPVGLFIQRNVIMSYLSVGLQTMAHLSVSHADLQTPSSKMTLFSLFPLAPYISPCPNQHLLQQLQHISW